MIGVWRVVSSFDEFILHIVVKMFRRSLLSSKSYEKKAYDREDGLNWLSLGG